MRIQWWWAIKLRQCKWRCRILPHWSNLTFMASVYNIHPLTFKETTQCEFKRWLSFYNLEISLIQKEAHLALHAVNVDPRGNLENLFNICGVFVHGCKTILCISCKTYTDLRAHCTMQILCLQAWSHWWLSSKVCCGCGSRTLTHWLMLIHKWIISEFSSFIEMLCNTKSLWWFYLRWLDIDWTRAAAAERDFENHHSLQSASHRWKQGKWDVDFY